MAKKYFCSFFPLALIVLSLLLSSDMTCSFPSTYDEYKTCLSTSKNSTSRTDCLTPEQCSDARLIPGAVGNINSGNTRGVFIKKSPHQKNAIPLAAQIASESSGTSLTLRSNAHVNHPGGTRLFPNNSTLAQQFNDVIATVKRSGAVKVPASQASMSFFVPLFRKIQFSVLNDLYIYLTEVYSTFNLMHKDTMLDHLKAEQKTALNKKSIIVGHLLNVIQAQMLFICTHHQPLIPKNYGIKAGSLMLEHDYTIDPIFLLRNFKKPLYVGDMKTDEQKKAHRDFARAQQAYLTALGKVLDFFHAYTDLLNQPDPQKPQSNAFVSVAQNISRIMQNDPFYKGAQSLINQDFSGASQQEQSAKKIQAMRDLKAQYKPINPPLFFYDDETIRALKLVPQLAQKIPAQSAAVGWPDHLIKKAQAGTEARDSTGKALGFVIAYFEDEKLAVTKSLKKAAKLFINLPDANGYPYAQEVLRQPDWLNSSTGIISMLRACLGDYYQLIGLRALTPCVEAILCKAKNVTCPPVQITCAIAPSGDKKDVCNVKTHPECVKSCECVLDAIEKTQNRYMQATQTTVAEPTTVAVPSTQTPDTSETTTTTQEPSGSVATDSDITGALS